LIEWGGTRHIKIKTKQCIYIHICQSLFNSLPAAARPAGPSPPRRRAQTACAPRRSPPRPRTRWRGRGGRRRCPVRCTVGCLIEGVMHTYTSLYTNIYLRHRRGGGQNALEPRHEPRVVLPREALRRHGRDSRDGCGGLLVVCIHICMTARLFHTRIHIHTHMLHDLTNPRTLERRLLHLRGHGAGLEAGGQGGQQGVGQP
jgi:hypothetical protein